ncbi:hypothetical protein GCM10007304_46770 [Rhodococcoides trifolii]|uniref:Centromere-binding protein ParB C-terminal domain-containing protein n=1 Tax=Rhodococcoides trifolii TaxID=908250 RepID=A0A917LIQ3_9NOCA|nr:hypothetical protein [Rhodococcus trifolii]GGG27590.1 hypothetical protein GCM10007304_46770 [Rhodococcus trifolii]
MQRPERIRSTLYNASPLDPPAAAAEPVVPKTTPVPTKVKRTFYFHTDTSERLLNAAGALAATAGAPRGPSDLVAVAVERYVDYLEQTFNSGAPFPQRTGPLQPGPRLQ